MAHAADTRTTLRKNYIGGMSLVAAAKVAKISYGTARSWKNDAEKSGDDWDTARTANQISDKGIDHINNQLVEMIARNVLTTIRQVEDGNTDPAVKVDLLTKLSDAYSKFARAFGKVNPQMAELAVAMEVIKMFSDVIRKESPKLMPDFERVLDKLGAVVTQKYG